MNQLGSEGAHQTSENHGGRLFPSSASRDPPRGLQIYKKNDSRRKTGPRDEFKSSGGPSPAPEGWWDYITLVILMPCW